MANTRVETVGQGAEKAYLFGALLFLVLAVVSFYVLDDYSELIRWGSLLIGLIVAVVLFFLSYTGKQLVAFGRDSVREMRKVAWPSRKEAIQMTAYVFAFVVVMAILLWSTDKLLEWIIYDLILGWKK
jgi:preprotein translocase subunit SecE